MAVGTNRTASRTVFQEFTSSQSAINRLLNRGTPDLRARRSVAFAFRPRDDAASNVLYGLRVSQGRYKMGIDSVSIKRHASGFHAKAVTKERKTPQLPTTSSAELSKTGRGE